MKKILVVDDVGKESKVISACLSEKGYDVVALDNVYRAAAVLSETRFDLILCAQKFFSQISLLCKPLF